jgi:hypothetical protein
MSTGPHLHYSVIKNEAGQMIEKSDLPRNGGSLGVSLDETNTIDPAQYDNYDPTPRFLDETRRAAQIISGTGASTNSGDLPSDRQASFGDRFGKWGSIPTGVAQPPAPGGSDSFSNHFGNWGSAPAGGFGDSRSPVLRALQSYKRSAAPDGPVSPLAQGVAPPTPNLPIEESAYGGRPENAPGGPRPNTYPQLRRISSAFPGITPPNLDQATPPERAPLLGIFSGKPMSLSPLPLPLGGLLDNSNASGNDDWFNFLAGLAFQNPAQPAPPPQTGSEPVRSLGRSLVNQSQASVARAPAAPLAPSDDANFSGGLLGRFAALAGIDPENPTQASQSPLDDELRRFYRNDPAWLLQLRR